MSNSTDTATANFASVNARANLIGLTRAELSDAVAGLGVPERQRKMRVGQLWRWMYNRGATDFDEMSDLGKDLRQRLQQRDDKADNEADDHRPGRNQHRHPDCVAPEI